MRYVFHRDGNWNNSTNTGTFNVNANNSSTNHNRNYGTRLTVCCKFILHCSPCLLAKDFVPHMDVSSLSNAFRCNTKVVA